MYEHIMFRVQIVPREWVGLFVGSPITITLPLCEMCHELVRLMGKNRLHPQNGRDSDKLGDSRKHDLSNISIYIRLCNMPNALEKYRPIMKISFRISSATTLSKGKTMFQKQELSWNKNLLFKSSCFLCSHYKI